MVINISILLIFLGLFLVLMMLMAFLAYRLGHNRAAAHLQKMIPRIRRNANQKSRQVIRGGLVEEFAPYLPGFPFHPQDCKFIGRPIDFIAFSGLYAGKLPEIYFIEVKSGQSRLSEREQWVKQAVLDKNVFWYEYRFEPL